MFGNLEGLKKKAKETIVDNFQKTGNLWIAPSWPHYKDAVLWDACFHAMVCHELGLNKIAENELKTFFAHQDSRGWIPHVVFLQKTWSLFSEREYYIYPNLHSNYTQPPVFAQALEWLNNPEFTQEYLEKVAKFYLYFLKYQDPDKDNLISSCHPHETGRDSSPEFDFILGIKFLSNKIPLASQINGWRRWKRILRLDKEYQKVNWDIDKIWQLNLFNMKDVMFNCIWVDGMRSLARLAKENKDKVLYNALADQVEKAIFSKMYDPIDKFFYPLNSQNQLIKIPTISGLFPLILENIPQNMVEALVAHLINPQEFATPYPIPSVPRNNPKFDSGKNIASCNWMGPVWINMNWFIVGGLVLQAERFNMYECFKTAIEIAKKTMEMVGREGCWEFYNPFTGEGLRISGYSWSTLVITLPKLFG